LDSDEQYSVISCARKCLEDSACESFTFNMTSFTCVTNGQTTWSFPNYCAEKITYGRALTVRIMKLQTMFKGRLLNSRSKNV